MIQKIKKNKKENKLNDNKLKGILRKPSFKENKEKTSEKSKQIEKSKRRKPNPRDEEGSSKEEIQKKTQNEKKKKKREKLMKVKNREDNKIKGLKTKIKRISLKEEELKSKLSKDSNYSKKFAKDFSKRGEKNDSDSEEPVEAIPEDPLKKLLLVNVENKELIAELKKYFRPSSMKVSDIKISSGESVVILSFKSEKEARQAVAKKAPQYNGKPLILWPCSVTDDDEEEEEEDAGNPDDVEAAGEEEGDRDEVDEIVDEILDEFLARRPSESAEANKDKLTKGKRRSLRRKRQFAKIRGDDSSEFKSRAQIDFESLEDERTKKKALKEMVNRFYKKKNIKKRVSKSMRRGVQEQMEVD